MCLSDCSPDVCASEPADGVSACIPADDACDSGDCPDGTACVQNRCRTECDSAAQCAGGQECLDGLCYGTDATHDKIGRASCRERVKLAVSAGAISKRQ